MHSIALILAYSCSLSNRPVKPLALDMGIEGPFLLWGLGTGALPLDIYLV